MAVVDFAVAVAVDGDFFVVEDEVVDVAAAATHCCRMLVAAEVDRIMDRQVAEVSIHGAGMIGRPGVAAKMFATLAAVGVNIEIICTSEVQAGCIIGPAAGDEDADLKDLCPASAENPAATWP